MGGLSTKFSAIVEDLKTSWYFRVWALSWLVFAIVTFIALILLGQRATNDQLHPTWTTWIENAGEISFPDLLVKTNADEPNDAISNIFCEVGNPNDPNMLLIPLDLCPGGVAEKYCRLVIAGGFTANPAMNALTCYINITAPQGADTSIAITVAQDSPFGKEVVYVRPTMGAVVAISKIVVKAKGQQEAYTWRYNMQYKYDVVQPNYFVVKFVINNFMVTHFVEDIGFDSWLSIGGIGGFAYFMVILHTIAMTLVGLCLTPESKFLYGGEKASTYNQL